MTTMTTKQIAVAVSKPERTVHNWIKRVSANMEQVSAKMAQARKTSKPAEYSFDETIEIIKTGMGVNAALIFKSNAQSSEQTAQTPDRSGGDDYVKRGMELVFGAIGKLDQRLSSIENKIEERQILLPAPDIAPRKQVEILINDYVSKEKCTYPEARNMLYRYFNATYNQNVNVSAKNRNIAIVDYIESEGMIDNLLQVAIKYLK